MKLILIFLSLIIFYIHLYAVDSSKLLRRKRDAGVMDQLSQAIAKFTGPLMGSKQTAQNNEPIVGRPSLGNVGEHGTVNEAGPGAPSVMHAVGFCDDSPRQCAYLECLAHNFKNSEHASNLRQGTKVMADPELRDAIANDPQVSKIACDKANLDDAGCNGFKQLMGLVSKLDPKSAHVHDEPREKRSPDYYDTLPSGGSGSGSGSKSGGGSGSGSKSGGSGSGSKSGGSGSGSKSEGGSGSKSKSKGRSSSTSSSSGSVDYYDNRGGVNPKSGGGGGRSSKGSGGGESDPKKTTRLRGHIERTSHPDQGKGCRTVQEPSNTRWQKMMML